MDNGDVKAVIDFFDKLSIPRYKEVKLSGPLANILMDLKEYDLDIGEDNELK